VYQVGHCLRLVPEKCNFPLKVQQHYYECPLLDVIYSQLHVPASQTHQFHFNAYLPNPSNDPPPKAVYVFQKFLLFLPPYLTHMYSPPQTQSHYPYKVKLCVLLIMYYHNWSVTLHFWAKLAFTELVFFSHGKRSHLQH